MPGWNGKIMESARIEAFRATLYIAWYDFWWRYR